MLAYINYSIALVLGHQTAFVDCNIVYLCSYNFVTWFLA